MYESIKTAIYVVGYGGCAAIAALCWGAVRFYRSLISLQPHPTGSTKKGR